MKPEMKKAKVVCYTCKGTGKGEGMRRFSTGAPPIVDCDTCNGKGWVKSLLWKSYAKTAP